jgi:hypothetical protein
MAQIKKFDDFNKVNEGVVIRPTEQDILDYAEKYGNEALGYAICDLIENSAYRFPEDLPGMIWEYDGNTGNF